MCMSYTAKHYTCVPTAHLKKITLPYFGALSVPFPDPYFLLLTLCRSHQHLEFCINHVLTFKRIFPLNNLPFFQFSPF